MKNLLQNTLSSHKNVLRNITRQEMIKFAVANKEAMISENGCLATWMPVLSTGRRPRNTYIVKRTENEKTIDWTGDNNIPIDEATFNMAFEDGVKILSDQKEIFVTDRVIGADPAYSLPVKTITEKALHTLFIDNMFREIPKEIEKSIFYDKEFTLLVLPYAKLDQSKYTKRVRTLETGETADIMIAMDMERRIGLIIGSAYMGSMKKMLFTVMNYYLPFENILPLHCSANEGEKGDCALLLGLSGTGKTTLSADPKRALLGDDEHGWSENGVANFENGCYAKMIDIKKEKEPDIYDAVMHQDNYLNHGAIVENAMIYPNGKFDFFDERLTENSRASYPLHFLKNTKKSSMSGHAETILFLTADAYGVLPPVAKLDKNQAMLWFLMGYTSKLAGTETGITEPIATFSRFFGAPFMPCNPDIYAKLLGEKIDKYHSKVYLINTGWSGGPYGIGKRIDITVTRKIVECALNGDLENVEYEQNNLFHLNIPKTCPEVETKILNPINTWGNQDSYVKFANKLAAKFREYFDKTYGNKNISEEIKKMCPGK